MGNDGIRLFIRAWTPPGLVKLIRGVLNFIRPAPWEYVLGGWPMVDKRIKGWNEPSIAETQKKSWTTFVEGIKGTRPLCTNPEAPDRVYSEDIQTHNMFMAFSYVLTLTAREKKKVSILDWGGGMGHYYLICKAILPEVEVDYYCQDLPEICRVGRELLPQVHFFEKEDACFNQKYDLVFVNSSLWYVKDWPLMMKKLVTATSSSLYVTRMLFVNQTESYVALQRPWAYGYQTEYACWIFNKEEFVRCITSFGLKLEREFFLGPGPYIFRAPEQGSFRGFLLRKPDV